MSPSATTRMARTSSSARTSLSRKPLAPAREGLEHVLVEVEGREDQDLRGVVLRREDPGGLDAVELGHADIHQDDVGMELGGPARPPPARRRPRRRTRCRPPSAASSSKAARMRGWSSATRTRIVTSAPRRAAARRRPHNAAAAPGPTRSSPWKRPDPLAHPEMPVPGPQGLAILASRARSVVRDLQSRRASP